MEAMFFCFSYVFYCFFYSSDFDMTHSQTEHRKIFTLAMTCRSNKSLIDAEKIAAALVSLFSFCFTNVRWSTFLVCFMMFFHLHFWACHWSRFYVSDHFFFAIDSVSCWFSELFWLIIFPDKMIPQIWLVPPILILISFEVVVRSVFWISWGLNK